MNDKTAELALAFAGGLKSGLSAEQLAEVRRLNATFEYRHCCASHDFTDANMIMAAAFIDVIGRGTTASEYDVRLWNLAWHLARRTALTAKPELSEFQMQVARHALGLDSTAVGVSYRNRYIAPRRSSVWANWMLLVMAGLAQKDEAWVRTQGHGERVASKTDVLFFLTNAGARLALKDGEQLDPEDFPQCA